MRKEDEILDTYRKWKQIYSDPLNVEELKDKVKIMLNTFEFVLGFKEECWTK